MPVLTEKEYRESKKIKAERVNEIKSINPIKPEIKKEESKIIYVLQYPEIRKLTSQRFGELANSQVSSAAADETWSTRPNISPSLTQIGLP